MTRRTMRPGLLAMLICATIMAVTGFPKARNKPLHPLEGLYEVSATRTDTGQGFKFLVSLKSDGGKWVGEVRETPFPVTVKEVTVTGENSLTGGGAADAKGKAISLAAIARLGAGAPTIIPIVQGRIIGLKRAPGNFSDLPREQVGRMLG